MPRKSVKHTGNKTSPAQQRINRVRSAAELSRLLQLNFSDGACLITLTYDPDGYVPVGVFAEPDIVDWLRRSRQQTGSTFRYVRTAAHGRADDPSTVHRVVVSSHEVHVAAIAAKWMYGPAWVEFVESAEVPWLAERLAGNSGTDAGRRSWNASRCLIRS